MEGHLGPVGRTPGLVSDDLGQAAGSAQDLRRGLEEPGARKANGDLQRRLDRHAQETSRDDMLQGPLGRPEIGYHAGDLLGADD